MILEALARNGSQSFSMLVGLPAQEEIRPSIYAILASLRDFIFCSFWIKERDFIISDLAFSFFSESSSNLESKALFKFCKVWIV